MHKPYWTDDPNRPISVHQNNSFFCFSFLKKNLVEVKVTGKNALYKLNPNNAQLTESTRKGKKGTQCLLPIWLSREI